MAARRSSEMSMNERARFDALCSVMARESCIRANQALLAWVVADRRFPQAMDFVGDDRVAFFFFVGGQSPASVAHPPHRVRAPSPGDQASFFFEYKLPR